MPHIDRRRSLTTGAALSGLAITHAPLDAWAQTAPRRGGTLRMSVDQAVGTLNPLAIRVTPEYLVAERLYSALTRLKNDMTAEKRIAPSLGMGSHAAWISSRPLLRGCPYNAFRAAQGGAKRMTHHREAP